MKILLLGRDSSVTKAVYSLLDTSEEWATSMYSSWDESETDPLLEMVKKAQYDLLIINLEDFDSPPTELIQKITNLAPSIPLLVIHSYNNELLIDPLIQAGAIGYLQNGIPEEGLFKSVRTVANGEQSIIAESTY